MKRNKLTTIAAFFVALATFTMTSASALTSDQVQEIKAAVLGVPVPEMPAKATELVNKAEKKDRQAVAVTAVRAIALKHRSAAPLVISAVSKAAPELASAIAVAASEVSNEQASQIVRAAATSAPAQASEVIAAVSLAVPSQASKIASTVAFTPTFTPTSTAIATRGGASSGNNSGQGSVTTTNKSIAGPNFPLSGSQIHFVTNSTVIYTYNTPPGS